MYWNHAYICSQNLSFCRTVQDVENRNRFPSLFVLENKATGNTVEGDNHRRKGRLEHRDRTPHSDPGVDLENVQERASLGS